MYNRKKNNNKNERIPLLIKIKGNDIQYSLLIAKN